LSPPGDAREFDDVPKTNCRFQRFADLGRLSVEQTLREMAFGATNGGLWIATVTGNGSLILCSFPDNGDLRYEREESVVFSAQSSNSAPEPASMLST
jgi:hypothetical protein